MKKSLVALFIVIAVVLAAVPVRADTVTTYTSLSTWTAAAGTPIVTEDFSSTTLTAGLSASFGANASITGGLLNVVGQFFTVGASTFTFSPGTTAFGGDFDLTPGGNGGGLDLLITFSNATTTDAFIAGTSPQFNGFFGVTSNGVSITSVTLNGAAFTGNGESFTLDNLRYIGSGGGGGGPTNPPPAVPEPAALLLMVSGVGAALALKSRLS